MTVICPKCSQRMIRDIGIKVAFFAMVIGYSRPYEIYHADQFLCTGCGNMVVAGLADSPFWRHHYPDPVPEYQVEVYESGMPVPAKETSA